MVQANMTWPHAFFIPLQNNFSQISNFTFCMSIVLFYLSMCEQGLRNWGDHSDSTPHHNITIARCPVLVLPRKSIKKLVFWRSTVTSLPSTGRNQKFLAMLDVVPSQDIQYLGFRMSSGPGLFFCCKSLTWLTFQLVLAYHLNNWQ